MRFAFWSLLLTAVLTACSCSSVNTTAADHFFAVTGQVLDRTSDVGVPEAQLTVSTGAGQPSEYYTDSLGSFTAAFAGRSAVSAHFTVTKDGYSTLDTTLVLTNSVDVVWRLDWIETE